MSYLSDSDAQSHFSKHLYPYNGLLQMTQSLLFFDPLLDVVPIGHSIWKKSF